MSVRGNGERPLVVAELDRTLAILGFLLLLPSWLGLAGGTAWPLDLLAHFRWQYLFVALFASGWALWRRRRALFRFALLTLLLNAFLVGRLAWHPGVDGARAAGPPLRVLSLNVLKPNPEKQAVLDFLARADADVVFLMEVDDAWMQALEPLQARYPHRLVRARDDNFGVALLSRLPWSEAATLDLGGTDLPAVQARMEFGGRALLLLGVHTLPPMDGAQTARRDRQLQAMSEYVAQARMPALVVGDFNATPWSEGLRRATAGNLGFRSLRPPWTPTWRAASAFAIPIDQALCTEPLVILDRRVGPDVGSDHRALQLAVGWGG